MGGGKKGKSWRGGKGWLIKVYTPLHRSISYIREKKGKAARVGEKGRDGACSTPAEGGHVVARKKKELRQCLLVWRGSRSWEGKESVVGEEKDVGSPCLGETGQTRRKQFLSLCLQIKG